MRQWSVFCYGPHPSVRRANLRASEKKRKTQSWILGSAVQPVGQTWPAVLLQKHVLVFTTVCEADEAEMGSVWNISSCPKEVCQPLLITAFENRSRQGNKMEIKHDWSGGGWVTMLRSGHWCVAFGRKPQTLLFHLLFRVLWDLEGHNLI